MADLPRIFASPSIPFSGPQAQTTPSDYGAGTWHTLAQLADVMAQRQKPIDAAKASSEYDIKMDDAINALVANPDPNTWREEIMRKDREIRQELGAAYPNTDVQSVFNLHADKRFGENIRNVTDLQIKAAHGKQMGDIETLRSGLARRSAETDNPAEQEAARRIFQATIASASTPTMVAGRPVPPSLSPKQAEQEMAKFDQQSLEEYATLVMRGNPQGIFTDDRVKNRLAPLGNARILEIENKARIVIEQDETRNDRVMNKNKRMVIDAAEAQANFGKLNQDWLQNALAGNNPLVRPSEARHLQSVNEGTESGTGGPADIIWDEYTSGPRTIPRILKYREQLNQLSKQLGGPNKWILKYKNELQSDQTTIENQGIAMEGVAVQRENRAIRNMQTTYEAFVDTNPFLKRIMGNMAPRDKAQIEDTYRRQGANEAEKLLNSMIRNKQEKSKSIEQKHGDVLNYPGN